MTRPQYCVDAYVRRLRMTGNRILLVEGKSEKRMFSRLLDTLPPPIQDHSSRIVIDTAEIVRSPTNGRLGNREKVELVCRMASRNRPSGSSKLVGFVDRELRRFDCDGNTIADHLGAHMVDQILVWSRGHSMENYLFDYGILRGAVFCLATNDPDDLQAALTAFENAFASILEVACCVSLAARDVNQLRAVEGHVDWTTLRLDSTSMTIEMSTWEDHLVKKAKFDEDVVQKLLDRYMYWEPVVQASDREVIRWVCHGHISESIIWESFARCMYETCGQDAKKIRRLMDSKKYKRVCSCIECWMKKIHEGDHIYPRPVMLMLGAALRHEDRKIASL